MKVTVENLKNNPLYNESGFTKIDAFIQPLLLQPESNSLYDAFDEFVEKHLENASEDTILTFAHDNTDYLEQAINNGDYNPTISYTFFVHSKAAYKIMLEEQYEELLEKYGELILKIVVIDFLEKENIVIDSDSAEFGIIETCIDEYIRNSQDGYYTTFSEFYIDLMNNIRGE